jgi:hypothetical protein
VEINFIRYEAKKRGGELTGWPVDEGKWRRREVGRLHALRRAAWGHGTTAALSGAGGGRRGSGRPDRAEKAAGPYWDAGPKGFIELKLEKKENGLQNKILNLFKD